MGTSPQLIDHDDQICVFRTCGMPLKLGNKLPGMSSRLGELAYVNGITHGEAVEMEKSRHYQGRVVFRSIEKSYCISRTLKARRIRREASILQKHFHADVNLIAT